MERKSFDTPIARSRWVTRSSTTGCATTSFPSRRRRSADRDRRARKPRRPSRLRRGGGAGSSSRRSRSSEPEGWPGMSTLASSEAAAHLSRQEKRGRQANAAWAMRLPALCFLVRRGHIQNLKRGPRARGRDRASIGAALRLTDAADKWAATHVSGIPPVVVRYRPLLYRAER